ncbi:hypothetical protein [Clostridium botulinum]|nr:hypothetical protein [Clostridium botulinum]
MKKNLLKSIENIIDKLRYITYKGFIINICTGSDEYYEEVSEIR